MIKLEGYQMTTIREFSKLRMIYLILKSKLNEGYFKNGFMKLLNKKIY